MAKILSPRDYENFEDNCQVVEQRYGSISIVCHVKSKFDALVPLTKDYDLNPRKTSFSLYIPYNNKVVFDYITKQFDNTLHGSIAVLDPKRLVGCTLEIDDLCMDANNFPESIRVHYLDNLETLENNLI